MVAPNEMQIRRNETVEIKYSFLLEFVIVNFLIGTSTNLHESQARSKESENTEIFFEIPTSSKLKYLKNTNSGQCHKYNEYEIRPKKTSGLDAKRLLTEEFLIGIKRSPVPKVPGMADGILEVKVRFEKTLHIIKKIPT